MKIATFGQVISTKLNYLGVIICLGVAKNFLRPNIPTLGMPGHSQAPLGAA